jgi:hypothetical protein
MMQRLVLAMNEIWEKIINFLGINEWMKKTFKFDEIFIDKFKDFIGPVPELFKWLGLVLVAILLVLGAISFIKKFLKIFVIIAVIVIIIVIISRIGGSTPSSRGVFGLFYHLIT